MFGDVARAGVEEIPCAGEDDEAGVVEEVVVVESRAM